MTLTGDASTKSDENHRGDGILDAQSATKVRGDVADNRRDQADSQDADDEAQITAGDIWNATEKRKEQRCLSLVFLV